MTGFELPAAWRRHRYQRRGGPGVTPYEPDARARPLISDMLTARPDLVPSVLDNWATEPDVAAAGTAWLAGDRTPLGAAVVATVAAQTWEWKVDRVLFADLWLIEHGPVWAATAAAELMALAVDRSPPVPGATAGHLDYGVRRMRDGEIRDAWYEVDTPLQITLRVRHALAAVPGDVYAAAVAALAEVRDRHPYQRHAAGLLVPTETAWADEDCRAAIAADDHYRAWASLTAITSAGLARQVAALTSAWPPQATETLMTLTEGVGAGVLEPLLTWLDNADIEAARRKRMLSIIAVLPDDAALTALADRAGERYVRPALLDAAKRFPERAVRVLAGRADTGELLRTHVPAHRNVAVRCLDDLPAEAAQRVRDVLGDADSVIRASGPAVPPLLLDPPWQNRKRPPKPVVVPGLACNDEPVCAWRPGEREEWAAVPVRRWHRVTSAAEVMTERYVNHATAEFFLDAPAGTVQPVLDTWDPPSFTGADVWMRPVVARFGTAALPLVLAMARRRAADLAPVLQPFAASEVAVLMADWLARLKSARRYAQAWLRRHPEAAARSLVPPALGPAGPARRHAGRALLTLDPGTVRAAADSYGPEAAAAIETLLAADPLLMLPARIPVPPDWAGPDTLPPVQLRGGGGALPGEAVANLLIMLMLDRPGEPYAGVDVARQACEPASLARFGWALLERWLLAEAPARDVWVLDALSRIGDDEAVRRLTPLILAWPGEGASARAVAAVRTLAGIGSDLALQQLHGIALRARNRAVEAAAEAEMADVAAGLGLSAEQLADRLVPRLGLGPDGTLVLDYGPRRFTVGFDEQLRPCVSDSDGRRLKALPRPGARDDAELAPAAHQRFTTLKRDTRTAAADLIRRLERAMTTGRQWTPDEFRQVFLDHPLVRHIARRLVWTTGDLEFRVAEDLTLAGRDDDLVELGPDARIAVAHPVAMGDWAGVFADYAIMQPFRQIGREVFTLAPAEESATNLTRFAGRTAPAVRLVGLERRGWTREAPGDGGVARTITFAAAPGLEVVMELDPGIYAGDPAMCPEQTLSAVTVRRPAATVTFGELSPAAASEMLRDLTEVTA